MFTVGGLGETGTTEATGLGAGDAGGASWPARRGGETSAAAQATSPCNTRTARRPRPIATTMGSIPYLRRAGTLPRRRRSGFATCGAMIARRGAARRGPLTPGDHDARVRGPARAAAGAGGAGRGRHLPGLAGQPHGGIPGGDRRAGGAGPGRDGRVPVAGGPPASAEVDPPPAGRGARRRGGRPARLGGGRPHPAAGVPGVQGDGGEADGAGGGRRAELPRARPPGRGRGPGGADPGGRAHRGVPGGPGPRAAAPARVRRHPVDRRGQAGVPAAAPGNGRVRPGRRDPGVRRPTGGRDHVRGGAGDAASERDPRAPGAELRPDTGGDPLSILAPAIEAILFSSNRPLRVRELQQVTDSDRTAIERALEELRESLTHRGLMLQRHHDQVQLVTRPELAGYVRRALRPEVTGRLSTAAYETLAIVAYQQPVSRSKIEEIRGVNSDGVVSNLELRDLVKEVGRGTGPGQPKLYGTTMRFLQMLGLESLEDLPFPDTQRLPDQEPDGEEGEATAEAQAQPQPD